MRLLHWATATFVEETLIVTVIMILLGLAVLWLEWQIAAWRKAKQDQKDSKIDRDHV